MRPLRTSSSASTAPSCVCALEIDLANHDELRSALASCGEATDLWIDVTDLAFIDWVGISLILAAGDAVRARGGRAAINGAGTGLRQVLRALGREHLIAAA